MNPYEYAQEDRLTAKLLKKQLARKEERAMELVSGFAKKHITCLGLSLGKDSMTVLHLAHKSGVLKNIELVLFSGSLVETEDTLLMIKAVEQHYCIRIIQTHPTAEELASALQLVDMTSNHPNIEFVYECLERPRWKKMDEFGIDGTLLGLRAAESRGRKINFRMRGFAYYNQRERVDIGQPIADWSTQEVFAYAAAEGIPLHPIYGKFAAFGIDRFQVRQNSIFDIKETSKRDYVLYKRVYPQAFEQAASYLPLMRNYA